MQQSIEKQYGFRELDISLCVNEVDEHWRIYKEYSSSVLVMIEQGHVYDGCMQFKSKIPHTSERPIYQIVKYPKYVEWRTSDIEGSLHIAQIMVKIQQGMCNYNKALAKNDIHEKRLILYSPEMTLYPSH